jgi:hypothetical protein
VLSHFWKPKEQLIAKNVFGICQTQEDEEFYAKNNDEVALRRECTIQGSKFFSNIGGIAQT